MSHTPSVYCQNTEQNAVLCAMLSSFLQRRLDSKRLNRNQKRKTSITKFAEEGGISLTYYTPSGPFRSNITLISVICEEDSNNCDDNLALNGTNRGHHVVNIRFSGQPDVTQIR